MSDWQTVRDRAGLELRPIHHWPGKRNWEPQPSPFRAGLRDTLTMLTRELRALAAKRVVLQIAFREGGFRLDGLPRADAKAEYPGVILSFESQHGALSLPCDSFRHWQDNLRAIAFHLEHLRHASLYGVGRFGEQYRGWKALPETTDAPGSSPEQTVRELSGLPPTASLTEAYRAAVRKCHPDLHHGERAAYDRLQRAWDALGGQASRC